MAVEETLTISLGADIEPLRKGLLNGARELDGFAKRVTNLGGDATKQGDTTALSFMRGLKSRFARDTADAKEELFRGLINPSEFRARGAEASKQFNDGILRGMARLGDTGQLTTKLHVKLVSELKQAGLQGGTAFSTGVAQGMTRTTTTLGNFGVSANRAGAAAVAVAFGLEAIARGGDAAEGGMRTALRATAAFAAMFGTGGLVVSGIAAATAALIDLFRRSRDEAEKTVRTFQQKLQELGRSGDIRSISTEASRLFSGDPFADTKNEKLGIQGLEREAARLGTTVDSANAKIAELDAKWRSLPKSILLRADLTAATALLTKEAAQATKDRAQAVSDLATMKAMHAKVLGLFGKATDPNSPLGRAVGLTQTEISLGAQERALKAFNAAVDNALAHVQSLLERGQKLGQVLPIAMGPVIELLRLPVGAGDQQTRLPLQLVDAWNLVNRELARHEGEVNSVTTAIEKQRDALIAASDAIARAVLGPAPKVRALTPSVGAGSALETIQPKRGQIPSGVIDQLKPLKRDAQAFADELDHIVTAGRGLLRVADAFGTISDGVRLATDSLFDALSALSAFNEAKAKGDKLGMVTGEIGVAGAAIGFWGGIIQEFGRDREERRRIQEEANRLLRENSRALEDQQLRSEGFTGGIRDLLASRGALNLPSQGPGLPSMLEFLNSIKGTNRTDLDKIFRQAGTSLGGVEQEARTLGITLRDQAGNFIPGAFDALNRAIQFTIDEMTHWQNTIADIRAQQDIQANVFDLKLDPLAVVNGWIDVIKKVSPKVFEKFFGGVDRNDLKALKEAEKAWVQAILDGTISLADLGIDKDEFEQFITGLETGFDALADAANSATEALRNAPSWFKLAGNVFAAAQPQTGVGARATVATTASGGDFVVQGDIVIEAAPGDDGEALYRKLRRTILTKSRTGGPASTARVLQMFPE